MVHKVIQFVTIGLIFLGMCLFALPCPADSSLPQGYHVTRVFPHDPKAFTQGLVFDNGYLYEGTGLKGQSSVRKIELETGVVRRMTRLQPQYFGEGITVCGSWLIQLTWKAGLGIVYDLDTLSYIRSFHYNTEGWGVTFDGKRLIMSDGTDTLYFLSPETFQVTGRVKVRDRSQPVARLNELEYHNGEILANVWKLNRLVRIHPETGEVMGWVDLKGLLPGQDSSSSPGVLNGIARSPRKGRLLVTGKNWPKLFEIEITP